MCGRFTQRYSWREIHELYGLTGPARNLPTTISPRPIPSMSSGLSKAAQPRPIATPIVSSTRILSCCSASALMSSKPPLIDETSEHFDLRHLDVIRWAVRVSA
jgi:hypothetical protein